MWYKLTKITLANKQTLIQFDKLVKFDEAAPCSPWAYHLPTGMGGDRLTLRSPLYPASLNPYAEVSHQLFLNELQGYIPIHMSGLAKLTSQTQPSRHTSNYSPSAEHLGKVFLRKLLHVGFCLSAVMASISALIGRTVASASTSPHSVF